MRSKFTKSFICDSALCHLVWNSSQQFSCWLGLGNYDNSKLRCNKIFQLHENEQKNKIPFLKLLCKAHNISNSFWIFTCFRNVHYTVESRYYVTTPSPDHNPSPWYKQYIIIYNNLFIFTIVYTTPHCLLQFLQDLFARGPYRRPHGTQVGKRCPWWPYDGKTFVFLKGIVSRDFVVCFLVSIDRPDISPHQEWVLLLLKVCFPVEFFDIRVWA
jgi:hypothetical protein